jgi:chromosome segregation ATPase
MKTRRSEKQATATQTTQKPSVLQSLEAKLKQSEARQQHFARSYLQLQQETFSTDLHVNRLQEQVRELASLVAVLTTARDSAMHMWFHCQTRLKECEAALADSNHYIMKKDIMQITADTRHDKDDDSPALAMFASRPDDGKSLGKNELLRIYNQR